MQVRGWWGSIFGIKVVNINLSHREQQFTFKHSVRSTHGFGLTSWLRSSLVSKKGPGSTSELCGHLGLILEFPDAYVTVLGKQGGRDGYTVCQLWPLPHPRVGLDVNPVVSSLTITKSALLGGQPGNSQ